MFFCLICVILCFSVERGNFCHSFIKTFVNMLFICALSNKTISEFDAKVNQLYLLKLWETKSLKNLRISVFCS